MNKAKTQALLSGVKQVYNEIAAEFSETRKYNWREFKDFVKNVNKGDKILDVGCGNGRISQLFPSPDYDYTGVDNAENFIAIAKKLHNEAEFIVADIQDLPFKNKKFDHVFNIAVLHHLPDEESRSRGLKEMNRVLKDGGHLYLMVWNLLEQKKYAQEVKNAKERAKNSDKSIATSPRDLIIPWGDQKLPRYYYAFKQEELIGLVKKAGFDIIDSKKDKNIILICKK
ncbi:class I SAM-dependent methyltransferase [Patescibacteria group bacterium]|nr:class I SAM-dependent methyltransferase [Patescibacteria group bacterium]